MTIYVGSHKEKLLIPADTLTRSSAWFEEAVKSNCTIFHFNREDTWDINLFIEFCEKGTYTLPKDDSFPCRDSRDVRVGSEYTKLAEKFPACRFDIYNRHAKLYVLAERFEVPALRTYTLNLMYSLLEVEDVTAIALHKRWETFIEERLHLIMRLYRAPKSSTKDMCKLLAFKAAENWSLYMRCLEVNKKYKNCLRFEDLAVSYPAFIEDVMTFLNDRSTSLALLGREGFFNRVLTRVPPRNY